MPIVLPNLDDRSYADLVEEARGLLVANAPDLTNHNPSDPVITLTELFAYFTDVLLFRVNNITDANRRKFLQLLNGVAPAPEADLDAVERTTVLALRQTDRAVTAADYESLARAADRVNVARAHCIAERNLELTDPIQRSQPQPGHISVVVVPSTSANRATLGATVSAYLEPRRLLTARVHVVMPRVVPVRVRATLRLLPDWKAEQVKQPAIDALTRFLDPLVGRDGSGWPLGRNVYVSEIYRLLDTLPGVDFVRRSVTVDPNDPNKSIELDELATTPSFAGRMVRNEAGELISIALDADELPEFQITPQTPPPSPPAQQDPDVDIVIELPQQVF
jgi:phage-related baseplate assembly protein